MAIDLNKQEIIRNMITEKLEWTSENLSKALKVHTSWIYNNKQKLEAFGFKIERKTIFNQM